MENPFVKLVREGDENSDDDYTKLTPSAESMIPEDKQKRLADLRMWRDKTDDMEEVDRIDNEIRKLEQE